MRLAVMVCVLVACSCAHVDEHERIPGAHIVYTWPRMNAQELGCSLTAQFGQRADLPACVDTAYPQGDPCVYIDNWYAGPQFPDGFAPEVHPNVKRVRLNWEHGHVQSVTLLLDGVYSESEAAAMFATPELPANVMTTSVQRCMRDASCMMIIGFDHLGAGEADCSDENR